MGSTAKKNNGTGNQRFALSVYRHEGTQRLSPRMLFGAVELGYALYHIIK
ncbi:hypothetical protein GCM10023186_16820 [Hymenobacter koreensis]|uniref:Uncharacterized protein n=1 Tax=Hymenobacter koreensis TaxID=1084523 RepID=A0ABP8IYR0_9BACT